MSVRESAGFFSCSGSASGASSRGDLRIECDVGWFQADASAAAVTGDAIFSAVWLGILLGRSGDVRCPGGGGDEASRWMKDTVLILRTLSGSLCTQVASTWLSVSRGKPRVFSMMVAFDPAKTGLGLWEGGRVGGVDGVSRC